MNCLLKSLLILSLIGLYIIHENAGEEHAPPGVPTEKPKKVRLWKRKPKPTDIQILFNSTDPELQAILPKAPIEPILDVQETFFVRITGTSYAISVQPMNWFKAYQMCRVKGGYLFYGEQRYKDINSHLLRMRSPPAMKYWSAASCLSLNNTFRWATTGLDLTPTEKKWAPEHPKSRSITCVYIEKVGSEYLMKTDYCNNKHYALCEILETITHGHKGSNKRVKKKTVRMHSIFT